MSGDRHRPPLPEGPFLVVGLARSGQAAAGALADRGERVIACDAGHPPGAEGLSAEGVEVLLGSDGAGLLERARCVVKSPGVPSEAPVIARARELGLPVLGELELAWRLLDNRFVAVTGTNGKTTVTELLGHLWRAAGLPVEVAGNVGTPLASLVGRVNGSSTVVCECSSFQLEDTEWFAPECGVLLNVSPDHLDRHRTMGEYVGAKLRMFEGQTARDVAVWNAADAFLGQVTIPGDGRRVRYCHRAACEVWAGELAIHADGEPLLQIAELRILGAHNVDNAMAAAAAALAMGLDRDAVRSGLAEFGGVAHRLERVGEVEGVLYVNDSKATNVAAAVAAIRSFSGGVHAILGGSAKGGGFEGLAGAVAERCRACYLIGEAAGQLESDLSAAWRSGVEPRRCRDLRDAVRSAALAAAPGEVVLLVPACASFDAYRDFEERGEDFRAAVEGLR